jgi:hypothetical protein
MKRLSDRTAPDLALSRKDSENKPAKRNIKDAIASFSRGKLRAGDSLLYAVVGVGFLWAVPPDD